MHLLWSVGLLANMGLVATPLVAQWSFQHAPTNASIRGMSVVDANTVWLSGTGGTFLWTEDGGRTWNSGTVPGALSYDFRAVHAVARDTAYLLVAAQDTGRIYYTANRGRTWTLQYDRAGAGVFFDAIAFFDRRRGLVLGDPVGGHFTLLRTGDGGAHWTPVSASSLPAALLGEAAFAASGTALVTRGPRHAWFATGGGANARVFRSIDGGATWRVSTTPIAAGNAAAGIFSLSFADTLHGVAVGGNYAHPDSTVVAAAYTTDGGRTWHAAPPSPATAYLSGVAYVGGSDGRSLVAVGTAGTSYSADGGRNWMRLNRHFFNVVGGEPGGKIWAAGPQGRVAKLSGLMVEPAVPSAASPP